jgi:hypothetical protein
MSDIDEARDKEIEEKTGISREKHENRNELNELPVGQLKQSKEDKTVYTDDNGRFWKLNSDIAASYHQPMHLWVAAARSIFSSILCGVGQVPNVKFISLNEDHTYSEVVANRYTGELVMDPQIMGTYNFCTDEPLGMQNGALGIDGEHKKFDIIPHEEYGGNYKHIAKGIPVGSLKKAPVVLEVM